MNLYNIMWATTTAGPSPDQNNRTELFLFGCERAKKGNPCKKCFNSSIWDDSVVEFTYTPQEVADQIEENAPNKYITISGGEPTDQIDELIELCKLLKQKGFHILVYTWKELEKSLNSNNVIKINDYKLRQLVSNIDILVDGEYDPDKNLYQADKDDGLLNSIGSGNQRIWDIKAMNEKPFTTVESYSLDQLDALFLKDNDELLYIVKDIGNAPFKVTL